MKATREQIFTPNLRLHQVIWEKLYFILESLEPMIINYGNLN